MHTGTHTHKHMFIFTEADIKFFVLLLVAFTENNDSHSQQQINEWCEIIIIIKNSFLSSKGKKWELPSLAFTYICFVSDYFFFSFRAVCTSFSVRNDFVQERKRWCLLYTVRTLLKHMMTSTSITKSDTINSFLKIPRTLCQTKLVQNIFKLPAKYSIFVYNFIRDNNRANLN